MGGNLGIMRAWKGRKLDERASLQVIHFATDNPVSIRGRPWCDGGV